MIDALMPLLAAAGDDSLFVGIGRSITVAAMLGILAWRLGQPVILAYIAAGILIGPIGLQLVTEPDTIRTISNIGLLLLLFIIGLEMDLKKLAGSGRVLLVSGLAQFLICFALGWLFFGMLGYQYGVAGAAGGEFGRAYLAVCCAISSTTIVIKLLHDRHELHLLAGRLTLGILIFQDLWAMLALALQPNLREPSLAPLALNFVRGAGLVAGAWYVGRPIIDVVLGLVHRSAEMLLLVSVAWCLILCRLAVLCGFSAEIGALIAGITISALPYHVEVASKVLSLRDFFITLFFVGLGMSVQWPDLPTIQIALVASVFLVVTRILSILPVLKALGMGLRASLLPTLNLAQMSEFSIVIATIGLALGHIDNHLLAVVLMTFIFTSTASTYLINASHPIVARLIPWLKRLGVSDIDSDPSSAADAAPADRDIVFLGFFRNASAILEELRRSDPARWHNELRDKLLVVDFNPVVNKALRQRGVACLFGDISHPATLEHAHLASARVVVCSVQDSVLRGTDNRRVLLALRRLAPDATKIVAAETVPYALELYDQGADFVIVQKLHSAEFLADVLLRALEHSLAELRTDQIAALKARDEIVP